VNGSCKHYSLLWYGNNYICKMFDSTGPCFSYINGTAQIKNGNHYLNTNIYSYLETFGSQSSNIFKCSSFFSTPVLIRHLWQLKTVVFLHWCLICFIGENLLWQSERDLIIFLQLSWRRLKVKVITSDLFQWYINIQYVMIPDTDDTILKLYSAKKTSLEIGSSECITNYLRFIMIPCYFCPWKTN